MCVVCVYVCVVCGVCVWCWGRYVYYFVEGMKSVSSENKGLALLCNLVIVLIPDYLLHLNREKPE